MFDIEQRTDLSVTDRGEPFLLLVAEIIVLDAGDSLVLVRPALEFIPAVPDERNAFLTSLDTFSALFRTGKRCVQVRAVTVLVTVKRQHQRIEGRHGRSIWIKPRGRFSGWIQEGSALRPGLL